MPSHCGEPLCAKLLATESSWAGSASHGRKPLSHRTSITSSTATKPDGVLYRPGCRKRSPLFFPVSDVSPSQTSLLRPFFTFSLSSLLKVCQAASVCLLSAGNSRHSASRTISQEAVSRLAGTYTTAPQEPPSSNTQIPALGSPSPRSSPEDGS